MRSVIFTAVPRIAWRAILQSDLAPVLLAGDVAAFAIAREILGPGGPASYIRLLPITLGILVCLHVYRPGLTIAILRDVPILVPSLLAAITIYYALVRAERSIGLLFLEALVLLSALISVRALIYVVIRAARMRGLVNHPVAALIGNGTLTWRLAQVLATHREFGLHRVGVIDNDSMREDDTTLDVVGGPTTLPEILAQRRAAHVIVFGGPGDSEFVESLRICADRNCTVFVVPRLYEFWDRPCHSEEVRSIPLVRVRSSYGHRASRIATFIRATFLDELPQLWNVPRGEMTMVGPRFEGPLYVDQFASAVPRYVAHYRVPVGLTGWAQIHGLRGQTSIEDRVRFDNNYTQRWSFRVDLAILLRIVGHLVCVSARNSSVRMSSPASCRPSRHVQEMIGREQ